jgi:hypothetical protein
MRDDYDDDNVIPNERPLDLGLAFDERDPDDLDEADDETGRQYPQDAAEDGFDPDDDVEERVSLGHPKQTWQVQLA